MIRPILKKKSRILRPCEFKLLVDHIPKLINKQRLEVLLYTGARYPEIKYLFKHPELFDPRARKITNIPSMKKKATKKERNIVLNAQGVRAVECFLAHKENLPHYTAWRRDLIRWAKLAGIATVGLGTKTTRKTYESYLITHYGDSYKMVVRIIQSQGHNERTAIEHYFDLEFYKEDEEELIPFVIGWGEK